jgi:hypothetical protein
MKGALRVGVSIFAGTVALCAGAFAQNIGDPGGTAPAAPASPAPAAPPAGAQPAPAEPSAPSQPTQTVTTTYHPIGVPAPGYDINPGLPSSSRPSTDTSKSGDTFDLVGPAGPAQTARGDANASGVLGKRTSTVPNVHQVKRGDTLWDLCGSYFNNPWAWPKVWSYNPQIQNPHWIYPGDQLRMRTDTPGGGGGSDRASIVLGGAPGQRGGGFIDRRSRVPHDTVFLRDVGYIDDPKKDIWGELVGAQEEQMLLTQGNNAYLIMRPGVDLKLGQLLTVFRSVRTPASVPGARKPKGEIIAFKGTVKIDQWNPKTRVARGRLVESLDIIERGDKLGPVGRRFEVVPPRRNETDTEAHVLATIYPHEVIGQNQVVFIDRGSKDGIAPGNRLFVLRRGDAWRRSLETTTTMARTRVRLDVPEHVATDVTPLEGNPKDFPEEVVGEVRVLRTEAESSAALVTASQVDLQIGDRLVARRGY